MSTLRTALVFSALAILLFASEAFASPACDRRANNTPTKLLECVTLEGVLSHATVLQDIADANGGTRSTGTPGFDASVAYVADVLENAGYEVTIQSFPVPGFAVMSSNIIAETPGGDPENVIVVGAQLDSVNQGPGIQDNGFGSAAILETAVQMSKVRPHNKIRFAWWGATENGLVGSDHYVFGLTAEERAGIRLYLNFDQIGSPNYVRFIYDGDGSEFGISGPEGSAAIEAFFQGFYSARGLEFEPTEFNFRSDYASFFDSGIPVGGLFTGAEVVKTEAQEAIYGGISGEQFDQCYHLACDTIDNVSSEVLDLNADAVAAATLHYAMMRMGASRPIPPICETP